MGDEERHRMAAARALAREVNDQIERVALRFESSEGEFLCECGRSDCGVRLRLSIEEYQHIRSSGGRFLIVLGHEIEPDRVVERTDRYLVAELSY